MPDISKIKHKRTGTVYDIKDATARSGLESKQNTLTFDSTPTENSSNPVTSGGIYSAINAAISGNFLVVESLPTSNISTHTIYLVLKSTGSETGNVYSEYIYINNSWEKIGETTIDLSGYQTLLTFDSTPTTNSSNPVTSGGVASALANKANTSDIPTKTSDLTNDSNYITSTTVTVNLSTTWTDGGQTVDVTGVTPYNNVIIGLASTASQETIDAAGKAKIVAVSQGAGTITVRAYGTVPTVAIPITVMILN